MYILYHLVPALEAAGSDGYAVWNIPTDATAA